MNLRHLLLNYERFPVIYVLILANDLDENNIKDEIKLFTKNYVLPEILKLFYKKILLFSNNEAEFVKDFLRGELPARLFSKLFETLESSIENQLMDLNKKQLESFFTKISSDKQDFISNKSFKDFILFKNNLIKEMHNKKVLFKKAKTLSEFNVLQPIDFVKIINDLFAEIDQPFNSKLDFSMLTSAMFIPISKFFKVYYDYDYKDRIIFKEKVKDLNENLNNFSDTIKEMDFEFYKRYQITWESYFRIFNELLKK